MTTAAQIKKLLRPVVDRYDDLTLVGRWIILKPVRHLARGIVIDNTGEAKRFRPFWAVIDLCEPLERFPLNWGEMYDRTRLVQLLREWEAYSVKICNLNQSGSRPRFRWS